MKKIIDFLLFPFKLLFNLVKFILDDLKKDIITIKKLCSGEIPLANPRVKEILVYLTKPKSYIEILASNWLFFLIIFLAFCSGFVVASQKFEAICNDYILNDVYGDKETCIENCNLYTSLKQDNYSAPVITFNFAEHQS